MTTEIRINTNGGHAVNVIVQTKVNGKFSDNLDADGDGNAVYPVEAGTSNYTTHVHGDNRIIIEEVPGQRETSSGVSITRDADDSAANADADATTGAKRDVSKSKVVTDKDIK